MAYLRAMQKPEELRATFPPSTRPADFEQFWASTISELRAQPADIKMHAPEQVSPTERLRVTPVEFSSLGGARISGHFIAHQASRPRPLIVTTHGYNSRSVVVDKARLCAGGANVFCFDVRGFGLSSKAADTHPDGYVLTGIETAQGSILRGAVCDYLRGFEVALDLTRRAELEPRAVAFHGCSFAGGLALMAQATCQKASLLAVAVPTFGWAEGRKKLVRRGSGAEINGYLRERPENENAVMQTLAYFDTCNFAANVSCPSMIGVGLEDDVVPPETVFAIANHTRPAPRILEFPYSHSKRPEEALWRNFDEAWLAELSRLAEKAEA